MTLYLTEAVPQLFSVYNCDFWLASDVTNHTWSPVFNFFVCIIPYLALSTTNGGIMVKYSKTKSLENNLCN